MFQAKTIYETLAALTTGAVLLSGCGGAEQPVNAPEVPAAAPEPAAAPSEPAAPAEGTTGDSAAGSKSEAAPAPEASAAPAAAATAAPTAAPTASAAAKAPPAPKTTHTKAGGGKKGAQGSCGEGTCG